MKVLAMDKCVEEGLKLIREAGFEVDSKAGLSEDDLIKIIPQYDALIVRSETRVTPKIIEAGKITLLKSKLKTGLVSKSSESNIRTVYYKKNPRASTRQTGKNYFLFLAKYKRLIKAAASKTVYS